MLKKENPLIHIIFIVISLLFILPFIMVISISLTGDDELAKEGYKLMPKAINTEAYRFVFENPSSILQAYQITALQAFIGMFVSVTAMAFCAYPLSRSNYSLSKPTLLYILFTMLFSVGLVPAYIINTKYLRLGNTLWIYILPGMINGFQIIIFRTFFTSLPSSLVESAKIDGAREVTIFFRIILPLSKPVIATIALFQLLDRWNNWMTSLIYITDTRLYTLQYLLQRILNEAEFIKNMAQEGNGLINATGQNLPTESARFAMCVVAAGPMLVVFPFFQKYFTKGLTVGAVKG